MKKGGAKAPDEQQRLDVLQAYPLDDSEIAQRLDRLAGLAAQICNAPVGLVSIVEAGRQVFLGKSGTDLDGTPREYSFCAHAMLFDDGMVVPDAREDPRFRGNPLVTGKPHIRFYAGKPLRSPEGVPLGSFCVVDTEPREGLTKEQLRGLETLAVAAMALLDGKRLERASRERDASSRVAIDELQQRFNLLADAMPQLVWSTTADGMADYFNSGWTDFTGEPPEASHGAAWMDFLHPDDRAAADAAWRGAVDSGGTYEVEYRLRNRDGAYRWVIARGLPMKGDDGEISRWIGTCTDIHDHKLTEERLALLSRELNHRIKNIFAVIGGLISLTFRNSKEGKAAARDLGERVVALGRAHDFVRIHDGDAVIAQPYTELKGMLEALLAPHGDEKRIRISGDAVGIDDRSATPLALFIHEMATNATKYGALSRPDGQIALTIRALDESVVLEWRESGGPHVEPPTADGGFGATLVAMSIERQLGGSLAYDWLREGLCVTATLPRSSMAR